MRQYGMISGIEYDPYEQGWEVSKERSYSLIITANDAEFEKSKRVARDTVTEQHPPEVADHCK